MGLAAAVGIGCLFLFFAALPFLLLLVPSESSSSEEGTQAAAVPVSPIRKLFISARTTTCIDSDDGESDRIAAIFSMPNLAAEGNTTFVGPATARGGELVDEYDPGGHRWGPQSILVPSHARVRISGTSSKKRFAVMFQLRTEFSDATVFSTWHRYSAIRHELLPLAPRSSLT